MTRRDLLTTAAGSSVIPAALRAFLATRRALPGEATPREDDFCSYVKNERFCWAVGPSRPWSQSFSSLGSLMGVQHEILFDKEHIAYLQPGSNPYIYSGVPLVFRCTTEDVIGSPTASLGALVSGKPLLFRARYYDKDSYTVDFYPHRMDVRVAEAGIEALTSTTFADLHTLTTRVEFWNRTGASCRLHPFVFGHHKPGPRTKCRAGERLVFLNRYSSEGDYLLSCALAASVPLVCSYFSADRTGIVPLGRLGTDGDRYFEADAGECGFVTLAGPEVVLPPGGSASFVYAVSIFENEALVEQSARRGSADWEAHEQRSRNFYQEFMEKAPKPPTDLEEVDRKTYYGLYFVTRHNEAAPQYFLRYPSYLDTKGSAGVYRTTVWTATLPYVTLQVGAMDPPRAQNMLREVMAKAQPDGRIGTFLVTEKLCRKWNGLPFLALVSLMLYEKTGDRQFLEDLYGGLERFYAWWFKERDSNGNGLCEWQAAVEATADANPVYPNYFGITEGADLNACLVLEGRALAGMGRILGRTQQAAERREFADQLAEKFHARFFDSKSGLYFHRDSEGRLVKVKSTFSLAFPLFAAAVKRDVAKRIIENFLLNEDLFWTRFPFADVAMDEYWFNVNRHTGPAWVWETFVGLVGLCNYGYSGQADEARKRIIRETRRNKIYEYYSVFGGPGFDFGRTGPEHHVPNNTLGSAPLALIFNRDYMKVSEAILGLGPRESA